MIRRAEGAKQQEEAPGCLDAGCSSLYSLLLCVRPLANCIRGWQYLKMAQDAPPPQVLTCSICQTTFTSRNRLFDHLRTDHAEQWKAMSNKSGIGAPAKRFRSKVVIRFGYDAHALLEMKSDRKDERANSIAAGLIQATVAGALSRHLSGGSIVDGSLHIQSTSMASEAKERPYFMAQDKDCSAASDVVVLDYSYETFGRKPLRLNVTALRESVNGHLENNDNLHVGLSNDAAIRVLSMTEPVSRAKLHAERSATQRAYHYLLPMSWLDGGREAIDWYIRTGKVCLEQCGGHFGDNGNSTVGKAPPVILRLKNALKSLESPMRFSESRESNVDDSDMNTRGRFGALGQRLPQSFHNYLPEHQSKFKRQLEGAYATIDRAKVVDLLPIRTAEVSGSDDVIAVVELRGDNFLQGQIRRHISEIIAMVNGDVPSDFHQRATSPGCEVDISLAPSARMYATETKYHFYEQAFGPLFPSRDECVENEWNGLLKTRILARLASKTGLKTEQAWLRDLTTGFTIIKMRPEPFSDQDERKPNTPCSPMKANSSVPDIHPKEVPSQYRPVLSILRDLVTNKQWPPTSLTLTRTMRSPHGADGKATRGVGRGKKTSAYSGQSYQFGSFVLNRRSREEDVHAELATAIFELETILIEEHGLDRSPSTHCSISHNVEFTPSREKGNSIAPLIVGLGDFAGGEIIVGNDTFDIQYKPQQYSERKKMVSTASFKGERFELCWFSLKTIKPDGRSNAAHGTRLEDERAHQLAIARDSLLPKFNPLKFRPNSTDALVVNEIFGDEEYEYHDADFDFVINGHDCVLDIGAHIGVFTRYALCSGATRVIAYEPEPSNTELLRYNSSFTFGAEKIEVHECAVAHGKEGTAKLIGGKDRSDGVSNTWRHSLEDYSSLGAPVPESALYEVKVVPFFNGALREGITFVKIDAEGAELEILLSTEASIASSWLDVTHLVLEYSFTKERRVSQFHRAIANLQKAGFRVRYEGMGAWWDTELGAIWPYHNDLVVFAMRNKMWGLCE